MKAILIDPFSRTISLVNHTGDLKSLYKLLNCKTIEAPIHYPCGDVMYCDEEAWCNATPETVLAGFMFPDWSYPILGKGLIVGTGPDGEDTPSITQIEDLSDIIWKDLHEMHRFNPL